MSQQSQPQWQPISQLALIASHIDGMLEAAQEQYETLQPARAKPHVLDNYTVGRVIDVYTVQKNDLWLFEEQLTRWTAQWGFLHIPPKRCTWPSISHLLRPQSL